jgi:UDP-N-acetylglucosamine--N-acetylmuramyl-(pentapeptide) pyrophosphoryl-undecaprenol N-acetylglucosamine transferase
MTPPAVRRIAVTGGGTAGHILPAVEFLKTYRREFAADGFFMGCAAGLESRLVPAHGERLEVIPGLPWARQGWRGKLRAVVCLPAAIREARRILKHERSQLVIGTGGYASLGACVAAYMLGVPVVIHEANAEPGLANRLVARFAAVVCAGFPETAGRVRGPVEVTGIPCGAIARSPAPDGPPWRLLVLGGSEGSPLLNREASRVFAELRRRGVSFSVRHLAGFGDVGAIAKEYADAGVEAQVDSFVDDIAAVYAGAALALASAGARTLAELSAAGIASLLIPLRGAANDHQTANARLYAERTGAGLILESCWDAVAVASRLEKMLADPREVRRLSDRAAAWSNRDAALQTVRACERLLDYRTRTAANPASTETPASSTSARAGDPANSKTR